MDLMIERRNITQCYKKEWFPLQWCRLEPVAVRRDLPVKALKTMIDQRILDSWNNLYVDSIPDGHWTRMLIPTVKWATERIEIRPNFLLTQAVTGHGAFNTYLYRIGKRTSPLCRCEVTEQTPEHVFRFCTLYDEGRPEDWKDGLANEEVRQYLIKTMRQLWEEEKEEEKSGLNRVRRGNIRSGAPTTGAGPASSSR